MLKKSISVIVLAFVSLSMFAQVDDEYSQTLNQMFEVSGSKKVYLSTIDQILVMYKQQFPSVEEELWNELTKELTKASLTDLTNKLAPIYAKYLTIDDLNALIRFYQTPEGKKYAEHTPQITQESMQVGQQWGMQIVQEFERKMRERQQEE